MCVCVCGSRDVQADSGDEWADPPVSCDWTEDDDTMSIADMESVRVPI